MSVILSVAITAEQATDQPQVRIHSPMLTKQIRPSPLGGIKPPNGGRHGRDCSDSAMPILPVQTMDTTLSQLLLVAALLAVVVLGGKA